MDTATDAFLKQSHFGRRFVTHIQNQLNMQPLLRSESSLAEQQLDFSKEVEKLALLLHWAEGGNYSTWWSYDNDWPDTAALTLAKARTLVIAGVRTVRNG